MMKGLQGERLRQAFRYLDADQDGFIRPDEFKRIILVCRCSFQRLRMRIEDVTLLSIIRKSQGTNCPKVLLSVFRRFALFLRGDGYLILRLLHSIMLLEVGNLHVPV